MYIYKIYDSENKKKIICDDLIDEQILKNIEKSNLNPDFIIIEITKENSNETVPLLAIYNINKWNVKKIKKLEHTITIFKSKEYNLEYKTPNKGINKGVRVLSCKTNRELFQKFLKIKETYYFANQSKKQKI